MIETGALADIGHAAEERGDYAMARQTFERGAELGDETCLHRLADMIDEGRGGPPNPDLAMRLYRRAWRRHRSTLAANNLAILYRDQGNRRAMFQWFQRGAGEGDASQLLQVAKCYLGGLGVRKSKQEALRCLARAANSESIFECDRDEAAALLNSMRPQSLGALTPPRAPRPPG